MLPADVREELQARRRMLEAMIRRDQEHRPNLEWEKAEDDDDDDLEVDHDGIKEGTEIDDYGIYGDNDGMDAGFKTVANGAEAGVELDGEDGVWADKLEGELRNEEREKMKAGKTSGKSKGGASKGSMGEAKRQREMEKAWMMMRGRMQPHQVLG